MPLFSLTFFIYYSNILFRIGLFMESLILCTRKELWFLKKLYLKPLLEEISFRPDEAIADDPNSFPYNDGELGWT